MELDTFWEQAWPATVIRCTRSVNPPEAHQRRTAERLHAAWHELETGHYPMLSAPEALTGLLVAVAPRVRSRQGFVWSPIYLSRRWMFNGLRSGIGP